MVLPAPGATLGFLVSVALATAVQNLTGFAFGLVLLGLVGLLQLVPLVDASNAATVLTLVNAASFFRLHRLHGQWRVIRPAIGPSLFGVAVGVLLLAWLSAGAVGWLRGLLGVAILACALTLLVQAAPREQVSSRLTFAWVGALSGLLGGLFSAAGPPMVFLMYRQPLAIDLVRHCLLLIFAINQVLRLVLVGATGQFSAQSALLGALALPVVHGVGWLQKHYLPAPDPRRLRHGVALLMLLAGLSLLVSAWHALQPG